MRAVVLVCHDLDNNIMNLPGGTARLLMVLAANQVCGLNLRHVIEIMRPLPIASIAGAPKMVLGLSVIRGVPVPVVALAALFSEGTFPFTRFVVVRSGGTPVALAADTVLGVREVPLSFDQMLPALLRDAASGVVAAIVALDTELFFLLNSSHMVPREFLESIAGLED